MIFTYGDVSKLKGQSWRMLELSNEKTIEQTMRRIGKAIPNIFRNEPVEVFIPVYLRDLDTFDMKTGIYIFIRTSTLQSLLRLKTVTGVVSLVTEGDSTHPSKAILADDSYVQGLIKEVEQLFWLRSKDLRVGNFVRIIDGETRDYCGKIEVLQGDIACVRINLKTKSILVETPTRNLLDLSLVPEEQQVFYYGPIIADLITEDAENKALIAPDLKTVEEEAVTKSLPEIQQAINPDEPRRYSRQRTITALVKRLVSEGVNNPMEIAKIVVTSIKCKDIKTPKNLFIVYCIIKDNLMKNYFKKLNPKLTNYREVIHAYGRQYKFSANAIAKIDPSLDVPILTIEPAKDGRSREARLKKKTELGKKSKRSTNTTNIVLKNHERNAKRSRPKISK